jgi:IclR family KDG regulon transcriptional repressor
MTTTKGGNVSNKGFFMVKREKSNYMIQSVSHSLDVLEELSKSSGEIGVTELSKRLKLHKNNVFRLLATLELRGFVEQNTETEDYRLGVKSLQLGQAYLSHSSIVARAMPVLRDLTEASGETASLAVIHNGQVQFPLSIESKRPVKVAPRIAVSFIAKNSAVGRLLTAQLSDSILSEILATDTPADVAIRNHLAELRTTGQMIDKGGVEADVVSISKVIRGTSNEVIGAIELLAPQYRARVETLLPMVEEAAQAISSSLGATKPALAATLERETIEAPSTYAGLGRIK